MKLRANLIAAAVITMSLSSAAMADDSRRIDFTATIKGLDGAPFQACVNPDPVRKICGATPDLTLGVLAVSALGMPEHGLPLDEQVHRGLLAEKVRNSKAEALTSDEITLIKNQIGKLDLNTIEVTAAVRLLDPASVK